MDEKMNTQPLTAKSNFPLEVSVLLCEDHLDDE